MTLTIEDLYQILKKNVDGLDLNKLDSLSLYSPEYDLAVYTFINQSSNQEQWIEYLIEIRTMEKQVSQLLTQSLTSSFFKAIGGFGDKEL